MKNYETFCKDQTARRLEKITYPLSPTLCQIKNYYASETIFVKEIYRNIQIFAFKMLQECSSWASRSDLVQIFPFLTTTGTCLLENFKNQKKLFNV